MNKRLLIAILITTLMPMALFGQTYATLWKQAAQAETEDLPRSQYDTLMKIVKKAEAEQNYAQLLRAELKGAQVMTTIAPDSLLPAVERMEARCRQESDAVLRTVYQTVLWRICRDNPELEKTVEAPQLTLELCRQLAAVKAETLESVVVKGVDSKFFGHDLLSAVGMQLNDYQSLHAYYEQAGERRATLLTALELLRQERPAGQVPLRKAAYLVRVDSLIDRYSDLTEAGEAVIERYEYMESHTDATAEEKWQYINWALEKYGAWQRMNVLRQAQRNLTTSQFQATTEETLALPHQEQQVRLTSLRSITQLTMRIYRVNVNGDTGLNPRRAEDYKKLKPLLTPLPELTQTRHYVGKKEYELFEDSITIAPLPVGVYMIEMESTPQTEVSRQLFFISNVRFISERLPLATDAKTSGTANGQTARYVVVNATTGQPVKGAKVQLTSYRTGKTQETKRTLTTDGQGEVLFPMTEWRPRSVFVYTDDDKACPATSDYNNFSYYAAQQRVEQTEVMTDRAIYRPGQTVHVAAFVYETTDGYRHRALEGKERTLRLYDANNKEVARQSLTTDRYGTIEADFTLPQGGLTGGFRVETNGGSAFFRVEEYKRPTFEVEFPQVNEHYEDGDTVVVKATARTYSGVPVQGARVSYKVVRRRAWWWLSYSRYWDYGLMGNSSADEDVFEGSAVTAQDGTFSVEMPMVLPLTDHPMFYNFVCTADVTDQAGETHQGQLSLPLGNRKTAFSVDFDDQLLREAPKPATFHLRNAAGIDISAEVRYRINGGKWQTANTNVPCPVFNAQWKSGKYLLEAICEQDTLKHTFTLFSLNDEHPATETDDWFYQSATTFPNDGSPVTIQVGSSAKDVHMVYSIISGNRVLESGAVKKSAALVNRKFTYKEEYGNGLLLTFAWWKQGRHYTHSAHIQRPLPDEHLQMEWHTFRDRLTPGQQEEWSLTVRKPDGTPADAQLMGVLYDKSLDQIARHRWQFTPYVSLPLPYTHWCFTEFNPIALSGYRHAGTLSARELSFSHFDDSLFPLMQRWGRILYSAAPRMRKSVSQNAAKESVFTVKAMATADMAAAEVQEESLAPQSAKQAAKAEANGAETGNEGEADAGQVQVRENLQETAFFYPRLQADSTGMVTMRFTLPESLTTWRFMGFAHTADMLYGQLEGETVAKKDVMIQPNVPRFLREGDKATITARIFNTSDHVVKGTARLLLIDPETEQTICEARQPFALGTDSTTSVSFTVDPRQAQLEGHSLLICKVVASGKGFSDGEQHYLPLLPNRERVTVSMPFTQPEPGVKQLTLPTMPSDAKLTVEYTNNPAWLMVQALPAVGHPHDDCAVCQAAALYANSLGQHIIKQNPQAKTVFEQWKREQGNETSLHSALEKNQELKDLVLNETPWVADADREDEQKQRLADFFDDNLMQQRLHAATAKLKDLQRADGAWSWWPQMPGSLHMTMSVTELLVRLNTLTAATTPQQSDTQQMLKKSFSFLGKEMTDLVRELKKKEKKGHKVSFPSFTALQWLYVCTLDGRELPADVSEANQYLVKLLKKERKNQSIYEKAMSAIILNAPQYVKSLKEFTVYREDMGRYYDTPRAGYSWRDYRIPTQVAAIEALQRLSPDDRQTIDEMRRWLLQQKRTQAWDTPLNSVDAVYAFLNDNRQALKADSPAVLKIDNQVLDLPQQTAGIGYVKTSVSGQGRKLFTAEKTSAGTSWGCVYMQFMQPMSDVQAAGSGIQVKREVLTPRGDTPLKVGDRITVRITIDSERDLDFVQVQDKRAACLEPVSQLSGYRNGYYCAPHDNSTEYFFHQLKKGRHVVETEYYVDRVGTYETGTCTVQCAYAPEFRANTASLTLTVEP